MSHGGCHSLEMAFVGGKAHGWWDSSSVGQEGPWGHMEGKNPVGLGVPVLFSVLFLSAGVPPARQEKGLRSWPGAHQDVPRGMDVPWPYLPTPQGMEQQQDNNCLLVRGPGEAHIWVETLRFQSCLLKIFQLVFWLIPQ